MRPANITRISRLREVEFRLACRFRLMRIEHGIDATCELIVMKGAAHGFPGDQRTQAETALLDTLLDWFDKYLAKSEDAK